MSCDLYNYACLTTVVPPTLAIAQVNKVLYMYVLCIFVFLVITINAVDIQYLAANYTPKMDMANMTTSVAVSERQSLGSPDYELLRDCRGIINSEILEHISTYTTDCHIHSKGCWGFYVVRTVYGDDQRVAAAMDRFQDTIENSILSWRKLDGPRPGHEELDEEARSRYHSDLIEHPSLDGANYLEARDYFRRWAEPYIINSDDDDDDSVEEDPDLQDINRSPRFRGFFLLDEQMLSNLETFPARGDIDDLFKVREKTGTNWLKLVGTNDQGSEGLLGVPGYYLITMFGSLCQLEDGVQSFPVGDVFPQGDTDQMWRLYEP